MSTATSQPRNHALWAGPALALFGFLSYYTIFYQWPALRDVPWLNLILLVAASAISYVGFSRARRTGGWRSIAGGIGVAFSVALTALLSYYCFSLSYGLPTTDQALAVGGSIPNIVLQDHQGRDVSLGGNERTLLVFYRGHW